MNRRSLVQLLIGAIATIGALMTLNGIRQDRCLDAGGQWLAVGRTCTGPNGPLPVGRASDVVAAIVVGALLAFMLHRASTFAHRGTTRR